MKTGTVSHSRFHFPLGRKALAQTKGSVPEPFAEQTREVGGRALSEDPVIAESIKGSVGPLQSNPVVKELPQLSIVSGHGVAQGLEDL
jgi:hypothetical protein